MCGKDFEKQNNKGEKMKNQILTLGVVSLFMANFSNADVDKVVQKSVQYFCQNSEVGDFKLTNQLNQKASIEFENNHLSQIFLNSEAHLVKYENTLRSTVFEYELLINSFESAQLSIIEKVIVPYGHCYRHGCDYISKSYITAQFIYDAKAYLFTCSKK
jgi:hypothetical protein